MNSLKKIINNILINLLFLDIEYDYETHSMIQINMFVKTFGLAITKLVLSFPIKFWEYNKFNYLSAWKERR